VSSCTSFPTRGRDAVRFVDRPPDLAARIEIALRRLNEKESLYGDAIGACGPRVLPPVACPPESACALTASPAGPTLGETPHDGARV